VIEPLRMSAELECSAEHAFSVWTNRFSSWWPRDHSARGNPNAEIVLEPRLGGRIFERAPDGREIDWGEVTVWEPPTRLAYLWHIGSDRADATDVELNFVDAGDGTARLELVHTGWERLGADGPKRRERNTAGWGGLLPHFTAACRRG